MDTWYFQSHLGRSIWDTLLSYHKDVLYTLYRITQRRLRHPVSYVNAIWDTLRHITIPFETPYINDKYIWVTLYNMTKTFETPYDHITKTFESPYIISQRSLRHPAWFHKDIWDTLYHMTKTSETPYDHIIKTFESTYIVSHKDVWDTLYHITEPFETP